MDRQHKKATCFVQLIGRVPHVLLLTPNTPIWALVLCYLLWVALLWRHRRPAVPVPTGSLLDSHHRSALDNDPPAPCALLLLPILPISTLHQSSQRAAHGTMNRWGLPTILAYKSVKKLYVNVNSNNLIPLKVVHVFVTDVSLGTLTKIVFYLFQPCFS